MDVLKEHDRIAKLKYDNEKDLVDYCGRVTETWDRSTTLTSIRRGFLANGMMHETLKKCHV